MTDHGNSAQPAAETADTALLLASNGHPQAALQVIMKLSTSEQRRALSLDDAHHASLLHWFALHGCLPAIKFIVELGANVSAIRKSEKMTIKYALYYY
jgi:ankyrin repeat protein